MVLCRRLIIITIIDVLGCKSVSKPKLISIGVEGSDSAVATNGWKLSGTSAKDGVSFITTGGARSGLGDYIEIDTEI